MEDGDVRREIADQRHGMGDEEVGESEIALEVAEEIDDLRANRDVEGGDGLVEDEHFRAESEGAGDIDALALASGKLVGVAREGGVVESDLAEELLAAPAALGFGLAGRTTFVDHERFGDNLLDSHAGIERGVGILKDGLDAAAERAEPRLGDAGDGQAIKGDTAGGGLEQAEDDAGDGAFAGTGFADEAKGLAALDGKGDAIDDRRDFVRAIHLGEIAGGDEGHRENSPQRIQRAQRPLELI